MTIFYLADILMAEASMLEHHPLALWYPSVLNVNTKSSWEGTKFASRINTKNCGRELSCRRYLVCAMIIYKPL